MDAIVLVGGQGTRLRPLTYSRHKSLVPVVNRPAIEYLFDWLAQSGITRVVLALGLANEDLAEAYPPGKHFGMDFLTVLERQRLESGGAIRNAVAEANITGRFVVANGDVVLDLDFNAALATHVESRALVTMALSPVDDPSQFGVAVLDDAGMIVGFHEKPPPGQAPSNLVNAGFWIFEPEAVDLIPRGAVRVEETLFPSLAEKERLRSFQFGGLWADYGTPARYLALNQAMVNREGIDPIGKGATVAADAVVVASSVGRDSTIASRSLIEGSVLWEHVSVGEGASINSAILADGVSIGPGCVVDRLVAGSGARVAGGQRPPPGTVLGPGESYG